jgi:hypothetical protein
MPTPNSPMKVNNKKRAVTTRGYRASIGKARYAALRAAASCTRAKCNRSIAIAAICFINR